MKILVPVKRVPDPTQKAKIKDGHIDLTGASWIVNTFDEYAVETALRLLENGADEHAARGGEIVVVSIGPDDAAKEIRTRSRWAPTARSTSSRTTSEIDSLVVVKVLQGDHRGREARPRDHGQAGRRRRREPGRPDARRQARLAAGDVRRDRSSSPPTRSRSLVGREVDGGVEYKKRADAGGRHRRPPHRRSEGGARTASRPTRTPTPAKARATVAQGHHGGEEEADRRRRSSPTTAPSRSRRSRSCRVDAAAAARRPARSSPTSPRW